MSPAMSDNSPNPATPAPAAWLRVDTPYPGYADAVVADLTAIVATASGRAVLEEVRASGRSVLIERPSVLDPPNAAVRPQDPSGVSAPGAPTGGGCDCTITYDPGQWPNPIHPPAQTSDVMLFRLLRQALAPLQGRGEPGAEPGRDQDGGAAGDEAGAVERYLSERDGE
jgi:hypothetical protein